MDDDPISFAEELTYLEAKKRASKCRNIANKPLTRANGRTFCGSCRVEVIPDPRQRNGNTHGHVHIHQYASHTEKPCKTCDSDRPQPLENFYNRTGALDGKQSMCKDCTTEAEMIRRKQRKEKYIRPSFHVDRDLWNAMKKVKGRQSIHQFINQAIRAEIERRVKDMWVQRGKEGLKREGEQAKI